MYKLWKYRNWQLWKLVKVEVKVSPEGWVYEINVQYVHKIGVYESMIQVDLSKNSFFMNHWRKLWDSDVYGTYSFKSQNDNMEYHKDP